MKKNIHKFYILNGDRTGNHFEGEIMKLPSRSRVKKERSFPYLHVFPLKRICGGKILKKY
jgi:hypothetical protein